MSTTSLAGAAVRQFKSLGDAEKALWWLLSKGKTGYTFICKAPLFKPNAIVDFYCEELGLAIEVEGPYHRDGDNLASVAARVQKIEKSGTKVLWIPDYEVLRDATGALRKALGLAGITLDPSFEASCQSQVQEARERQRAAREVKRLTRQEEKEQRIAASMAALDAMPTESPIKARPKKLNRAQETAEARRKATQPAADESNSPRSWNGARKKR